LTLSSLNISANELLCHKTTFPGVGDYISPTHGPDIKVTMTVKMFIAVFWVLMLCGFVGGYQCFRGKY
jgi:hypothetical protein